MVESGAKHRKVWLTAAAVSTTVLLLFLRHRQAKRRAARQSAADATRAALQKAAQRSLLPVFVHPESLPTGWGVAPPVFYPPQYAVVPLVLPSEMEEIERSSHLVRKMSAATTANGGGGKGNSEGRSSAFLLCTHTGIAAAAESEGKEKVLADLLSRHPILSAQLGSGATQWAPLELPADPKHHNTAAGASAGAKGTTTSTTADADAVTPVFTHFLKGEDNCILLGGLSGPYFVVAVLMGFAGDWVPAAGESASTTRTTPKALESHRRMSGGAATSASDAVMDLAGVIRGVARAALRVPLPTLKRESGDVSSLAAASRLPGGSAFAVHRGFYRVLCVRDGRELDLAAPTEMAIRSELVNHSLVTPHGSPVMARVSSKPNVEEDATADALLTLTFATSPFSDEDAVAVRVSEEVFAALVDRPAEAAATLWKASGAAEDTNPAAAAAFRAVTARSLAASLHGRANMVTIVYVQPQLGVLFSVHPLSAVVYEPWMTELPTVLYYPLGEGDAAAAEVAPPQMSIEYVVELPPTWEVQKKDEEELRHNVLFHFTNWEAETVTSSMVEISGIRCVMFHEDRDGRRCRSYVLPRGSTVLVVRWETAVEAWEKCMPMLQQTLDTLHVDAVAITK